MKLRMLNEDPYLHFETGYGRRQYSIRDNELSIIYASISLDHQHLKREGDSPSEAPYVIIVNAMFDEPFFELDDSNKMLVVRLIGSVHRRHGFKYLNVVHNNLFNQANDYLQSIGLEQSTPEFIVSRYRKEQSHYDALYRIPHKLQSMPKDRRKKTTKSDITQLLNKLPAAKFANAKSSVKLPELSRYLGSVQIAMQYYKKNGNGERWPELERIFSKQISRAIANDTIKRINPSLFDYIMLLNEPWPEGYTGAKEIAKIIVDTAVYIIRSSSHFKIQTKSHNIQDYANNGGVSSIAKFVNNKHFKTFIINNFPHDVYELIYGDARKLPKRLIK